MKPDDFATTSFTPMQARLDRLRAMVLAHVPVDRPLRLLDLGCGCGDLVFHLAEALPQASFTGLDVSATSIAVAVEAQRQSPHRDRIQFKAGDYMTFAAPPFDVIFAWSVVQWIAAPTADLLTKLAADLAPGGLFINGMPYECGYNRFLTLLRTCFLACRSSLTDSLFLMAARLVHGSRHSVDSLRERISYMYHLPKHLDGPDFRRKFANLGGVECVAESAEPCVSAAQLRSRLVVFRKPALATCSAAA